jgi:hypothetical protein
MPDIIVNAPKDVNIIIMNGQQVTYSRDFANHMESIDILWSRPACLSFQDISIGVKLINRVYPVFIDIANDAYIHQIREFPRNVIVSGIALRSFHLRRLTMRHGLSPLCPAKSQSLPKGLIFRDSPSLSSSNRRYCNSPSA